jgi:uncharacterized membrane protein YdbT with pleckstrin-like domain
MPTTTELWTIILEAIVGAGEEVEVAAEAAVEAANAAVLCQALVEAAGPKKEAAAEAVTNTAEPAGPKKEAAVEAANAAVLCQTTKMLLVAVHPTTKTTILTLILSRMLQSGFKHETKILNS